MPASGSNRFRTCLAALILSQSGVRTAGVPRYLMECPDTDKSLIDDFPLPDGLTPGRVSQEIGAAPLAPSDSGSEIDCNVYAAPWIKRKDTAFVVFLETTVHVEHATGSGGDRRMLRLGLYRKDPSGYPVVEAISEPREFGYNERIAAPDLESYPLTENQSAFGIRTEAHYFGSRHEEGHNSFLTLFRIKGAAIQPVLSTLIHSSRHGLHEGGEWKQEGGSATVIGLKRKTNGVYDLRKSAGKKRECVFKWTGSDYETVGRDPVRDIN